MRYSKSLKSQRLPLLQLPRLCVLWELPGFSLAFEYKVYASGIGHQCQVDMFGIAFSEGWLS